MEICYTKSSWEAGHLSLEAFAEKVAAEGYAGVEMSLHDRFESLPVERLRDVLAQNGLFLIGQVIMQGANAEEQLTGAQKQVAYAKEAGAAFLNAHTGSDFFPFAENVAIFRESMQMADATGLMLCHETHRGRALYNLPDTLRYLDAVPEILLTADLSHYMCVHETELRERMDLVAQLFPRVRHLHARIGFGEGPQVPHPLAPEWKELREHYLENLWKPILNCAEEAGLTRMTITPEAGPPPYMPVVPFSNQPIADAWTVNREMKGWLESALG